jgi:hypothetical protein
LSERVGTDLGLENPTLPQAHHHSSSGGPAQPEGSSRNRADRNINPRGAGSIVPFDKGQDTRVQDASERRVFVSPFIVHEIDPDFVER